MSAAEPPKRSPRLAAKALMGLIILMTATSITFHILGASAPIPSDSFGPRGVAGVFSLAFGAVGAIILSRRPRFVIGWAFIAGGIMSAAQDLGDSYSHYTLKIRGVDSDLAFFGVWLEYWIWIWFIGLTVTVLAFLFPSGTFLSRRWKIAFWISVGFTFLSGAASAALDPAPYAEAGRQNPLRLSIDQETLAQIVGVTPLLLLISMLLGIIALATRFRRSVGDERRQLLWLLSGMTMAFLLLLFYGIFATAASLTGNPELAEGPAIDAFEIAMILAITSIPIAAGAAILRYRLYSIEVVVNRAVVYGALAALITVIYGLAVIAPAVLIFGLRGNEVLLPIVATAIIALAVQPLRRGLQRFANRVVYGKRATPYEAMADFSHRIAGAFSVEETLPRIAEATAEGVAAKAAQVTLFLPDGDAMSASWPLDETPDGFSRSLPIRHRGELVGELAVSKDLRDPITDAEERLLNDLASQAGPALHNVRLNEELRASRRRLVTAQTEERKRIERDIHDGAQQQLVSLAVKLGILKTMLRRDPEKAERLVDEVKSETQESLETLRDLARGLFPSLLADSGLVSALESHASKSGLDVTFDVENLRGTRFDSEIEAALYFCIREALQNASKHAPNSTVTINLYQRDGILEFTVSDAGPGFDRARAASGSGLQNMADRVEALGGKFRIASTPGQGTTIEGSLPAKPLQGAQD